MKKRILASRILIASFVALLIASSLSLPASALIQYLEEGSSQWSGSGTQWDITSTGRGNHAYQYLSHIESNDYSTGRWRVLPGEPATTYWWWAWIPKNGLPYDAVVQYTASGGTGDTVSLVVNQEAYEDQWVYMGRGLNGNSSGNIFMDNNCVPGAGCSWNYQVWWDDVMYQHP